MTNEQLMALRGLLREEHLSAFIFPKSSKSMQLEVVTAGEDEMKDSEDEVAQWLGKHLSGVRSPEVAVDGMKISFLRGERLIQALRQSGGITLRTNLNPFVRLPQQLFPHSQRNVVLRMKEYTDGLIHNRLTAIRRVLRKQHADGTLVSASESIAWALGLDVKSLAENRCWLLIASESATLYINKRQISSEILTLFLRESVGVSDVIDIVKGLETYFEYNILLDPEETCYTLFKAAKRIVLSQKSPIASLIAV